MKTIKIAHQKWTRVTRTSKMVRPIIVKKIIQCSILISYNIIHFRSNKAVDLTLVSENFRYVACRRRNRLSLALKQRIDTFRTKQNKDIVHSKLLG